MIQGDGVRAGSRAAHGTGDAVSAVPASIPDAEQRIIDAWRAVESIRFLPEADLRANRQAIIEMHEALTLILEPQDV